jgi:hypothetical protein
VGKLNKMPSPWFGWAATLLELHEKEFPNLQTVADAIRGGEPIPDKVRDFLAGYIEGSIQRPRGRTKYRDQNAIDRRIDDDHLRSVFDDIYERLKSNGKEDPGTPFEIALNRTATAIKIEFGIRLTPDGIKKRLKLRDRTKR